MMSSSARQACAKANIFERSGIPRRFRDSFLKPGCTSLGGPVAHLSYFRRDFVQHRKWIEETEFARLLALCQFLPDSRKKQARLQSRVAARRRGREKDPVGFGTWT
jgi:hypothetical protein